MEDTNTDSTAEVPNEPVDPDGRESADEETQAESDTSTEYQASTEYQDSPGAGLLGLIDDLPEPNEPG